MRMSIFSLSALVLLFQSTSLSLAIPIAPSIAPRTQYCANAPLTVAGSLSPPSTLTPRKSTSTVLWCAPSSRTYVILTIVPTVTSAANIASILGAAAQYIQIRLNAYGDMPVVGGGVNWNSVSGAMLRTWNTNNHQQTYGVLVAALEGLIDYMMKSGWGGVKFSIFDGGTEVGSGVVG